MNNPSVTIVRIPADAMKQEFTRIFEAIGLSPERAALCAQVFTDNSCDGVASHGYNRVQFFVDRVQQGFFRPDAEPEKVASLGAWEQWDGNLGLGIVNALACTERAIELARQYGLGCVALRNTNHWLRPGTYGWKAAQAGFIFMCWTNTIPNMPPWGGTEPRLGNNPLVLAVPRESGPVVLDMAMTQFSFGKTELYAHRNQELPVPGGFDREGNLTRDPHAILESGRPLPIGYWKGSGLSLLLDLMATLLSGGLSTYQIGWKNQEFGVSQVYIAFDASRAATPDVIERVVSETLAYVKSASPTADGGDVYFPGERVLKTRQENLKNGIPVDKAIWEQILNL